MIYTHGWRLTRFTDTREGQKLFQCAMVVASQSLHLDNIIQVRIARGVDQLPTLQPEGHYPYSQVMMWHRGAKERPIQLSKDKERPSRGGYNHASQAHREIYGRSEWAFIKPARDIPAETPRTDFWSDVVILEPDIGDMRKPKI